MDHNRLLTRTSEEGDDRVLPRTANRLINQINISICKINIHQINQIKVGCLEQLGSKMDIIMISILVMLGEAKRMMNNSPVAHAQVSASSVPEQEPSSSSKNILLAVSVVDSSAIPNFLHFRCLYFGILSTARSIYFLHYLHKVFPFHSRSVLANFPFWSLCQTCPVVVWVVGTCVS